MRGRGYALAEGDRMTAVLLLLLVATAAAARLGDLARRDTGDVFTIISAECGPAQCAEHGAGANENETSEECGCACPLRAPLFREDRELCVDDLPECSLATFGTGTGVQRIPFVFLPLKGQIIHPSREINFPGVKTPICAVSGAQFLTRKGFVDLRNTVDADVPFNLFRDEGRTFLQWSGEDELRTRMSGRVMVVRLLCRDVSSAPSSPLDLRGVFTPCVAFRVQGTPPRHLTNVTEVQFAPNAHTSETTTTSGLTVTEYVVIGISSLLLGLIYVASVFLYLHIRKRRKAASDEGSNRRLKSIKKKDGTTITERDIVRINNERVHPIPPPIEQDEGVVKNNPLLSMNRQFHEVKSSFTSDSSNVSDSEDFGDSSARSDDNMFNSQTISAIIHPHNEFKLRNDSSEPTHRDESGIERLPDEHVSIVETTDDREIARPVGTTRRKLYFNPAYFEPHLMAEPPPAALEFLVKIREVIAIAKHKMATKRFQPILNHIPEEETYHSNGNSIDLYQGLGSQRSGSAVSLKRENSRKKSVTCLGCPGCKSDGSNDMKHYTKHDIPACLSCLKSKGDKQNSIREWLENIPTGKQQPFYNDTLSNGNHNGLINSLISLPLNETRCKLRKQNSFSASNSMYLSEVSKSRKSSTLSVRSEPAIRNYNLPLPEFNNNDNIGVNYNYNCQTVSQVDDIRPIGFGDYRTGSLRNNIVSNPRRNKFVTNKNTLPDMVNEAMALDNCSKLYNHSSSDDERFNEKNTNSQLQNSYIRNNSGSISGNDYETDSLERTSNKKAQEYLDIPSSQTSPSLSNALPLEEELTMRNAIYKTHSSNSNTPSPQREVRIDQNHYETIGKKNEVYKNSTYKKGIETANQSNDYSLVSEVYVNNNYNFGSTPTSPSGSECSMGSRKLIGINSEEKPGCLMIEVKDPPENYIKIHESDGFEPDTLDRKHAKQKEVVETVQFSRKDLLKTIDNDEDQAKPCIKLRNSGTFTKTSEKVEYSTKFNSLRYEYEQRKNIYDRPKLSPETFSGSKSLEEDRKADDWGDDTEWNTEEGRILTLELRHSKRQRQSTPPTIKQLKILARPDVLPPLPPTDDTPIYEQPIFPPRRVENDKIAIETHQKNLNGRSLSPRTFMKNTTIESVHKKINPHESHSGQSCSPMRASVQSLSSDYENVNPSNTLHDVPKGDNNMCRVSKRRRSNRNHCVNEINTNTFLKGPKDENHFKSRYRRKKGSNIIEDSGYLSSDSTSSRQVQRKLVAAKIVSCSESDDTENEARSESGAESVETHSVYFGSYRTLEGNDNISYNKSFKGIRNSSRKVKHSRECL